jgi:hypothetical protein
MRPWLIAAFVLAACGGNSAPEPNAPEPPSDSPTPTPPSPEPTADPEPPQPTGPQCGGIAGLPCPSGQECVDDPNDDCDPKQGGRDCGGICSDQAR